MNTVSSFGGLIPLWIIGAPLVFAIIGWMATPKTRRAT